ncbi:MAG: major capsid protein [Desulfobacteraceae bacterium]|nr:major capsid protein [Desulfobacteraceae bacterium]
MVNIRNLFTRDAIIQYLQILGPMFPTRVMDTVFTRRPQQPGPLIGSDIIKQSVKAMPLGRRGSRSITIGGAAGQTEFYEPYPIHPDISVTGADLNNLRMFMQQGNSQELLKVWAQSKTEILRQTVRNTAEAMCATTLSGKLQWPVQIEGGGFETYEVDYGAPQTLAPGEFKYWDDPATKVADILNMFILIQVLFQRSGIGGRMAFWAGKDAFLTLFTLASRILTSTKLLVEAGVSMQLGENFVMIGNNKIELAAEEYWNPQTAAFVPIVPVDTFQAIALDAGHQMPYASIDDLDGGLQAMPFFIKPLKTDNPSGYSLIAESKPLPVVNPLGLFRLQVLAPV